MLGIKVSSSEHGPDVCAIMLLNQSQRFVVVKRCSASREVGSMRETAVAPKVACLSSGCRILLASNPKDQIIHPSEPMD